MLGGHNGNKSGGDVSGTPMISEKFYTLAEVAAELDCGTREIIRRCNGAVVRDECGMRVLPGQVVRELVEQRDAAEAAYRERQRRIRENPAPHPVRERIKARKARKIEFPVLTGSMAERARLQVTATADDSDHSDVREQMQASDNRMEDYMRGALVYRKGPGARKDG
ncbi:hypothetical protein AO501_29810 [Mycobacterium gordonae]|uniref:Uncharacterized protein n=1 Tax=Mycobacterium gordonae TaxID=1778 RepID=A0A0Q2U3I1_MYCGO|nr:MULTISPECIES: hypothetical protein [Mycobacterium]KQH75304.1 hypothetical protein AO501_29810 [Mycobacterium gordonae]MDP7726870.1 hypothetical protein [Mycobacterium sp. TY813]